jgi:hypothetical protein
MYPASLIPFTRKTLTGTCSFFSISKKIPLLLLLNRSHLALLLPCLIDLQIPIAPDCFRAEAARYSVAPRRRR